MVVLKFKETIIITLIILKSINAIGEKAKEKCVEYSSYVYVDEISPVLTMFDDETEEKESACGIVETPLIIGGERVSLNEFPHMAAIGYQSRKANNEYVWNCGGAIISEFFILTAAHCSYDRENGPAVIVKVGMTDLEEINPKIKTIEIEQIINHPEYKISEKYHDIALYKLKKPLKFNEYVRPACISSVPVQWSKAIAIGFGKTEYDSDIGSSQLMKVLISNIDKATCRKAYQNFRLLSKGIVDSQICAGELEGKKDSCMGDSGGPLQIVLSDPYCMYQIIGITSFGKFCGFANSPGVYTDVATYIEFIESTVWP